MSAGVSSRDARLKISQASFTRKLKRKFRRPLVTLLMHSVDLPDEKPSPIVISYTQHIEVLGKAKQIHWSTSFRHLQSPKSPSVAQTIYFLFQINQSPKQADSTIRGIYKVDGDAPDGALQSLKQKKTRFDFGRITALLGRTVAGAVRTKSVPGRTEAHRGRCCQHFTDEGLSFPKDS